ncbi:hypothetical protein DR66_2787 [Delftia acidovorans]|uniref:hypothetical protein n=1 Tax=Delftia acidovorans TaxID=80866 RepID=UPI0005036C4C|nr:hypothetical protein [Delftia acidovorans]KFJ10415.1 hypothetical protein DR66_2787 [Delftia acidovorans]QQB52974.1 hypothetical protein I6H54_12195 [Delftia acidovorans]
MKIKSVIRYENAHAIEATWVDDEGNVARCHIYANSQMQELRSDLGAQAPEYEFLIAAVEATEEPPPPAVVPESCTPAQGLVALYVLRGITEDALNSTIEAIEDDALRYTTRIGFARATEWRRRSPSIVLMGELLSLSAADLDALFTHAVTVEV